MTEQSKIQNRKWAGLFAIVVALTVCGGRAEAKQSRKISRIGMLFYGSQNQPHLKSFQQGLRDLGYIEGKNIGL
jgi:hypothetical protein